MPCHILKPRVLYKYQRSLDSWKFFYMPIHRHSLLLEPDGFCCDVCVAISVAVAVGFFFLEFTPSNNGMITKHCLYSSAGLLSDEYNIKIDLTLTIYISIFQVCSCAYPAMPAWVTTQITFSHSTMTNTEHTMSRRSNCSVTVVCTTSGRETRPASRTAGTLL